MVIYFANRRMDTLGLATTELRGGFIISDDLKSEDTDTGVATFECYIHWTEETRELAKSCTTAGNYLLRSHDNENEFYTIIESEEDTKEQTVYIYAEDAGMDLLNETVGAFEADQAYPIAWYVEKYAADTGFEVGINEIADKSRKLSWEGETTSAGRIASVATQFDNAEISYSFDIKGLTITHKYINIHKKRGKDAGITLRLNQDVDRIITTTSVADLATALYVTGGIPEGEENAITLKGYTAEESDGDIYTDGSGFVKSRSALAAWSRYIWEDEPNLETDREGNIVKQWSYDTTSQSELYNRSVTQLKKVCSPAVNYQIDIQQLPANVAIGDTINIVDENGELYLQSRILQLETSICNEKQTATLGDFLIQDSGISATVRELAEQFAILAASRSFYTWTAYADDAQGNGISLDPTGKDYIGTAANRRTMEVDISDPSIFTWVYVRGDGVAETIVYYGVSDSPLDVPTEWTTTPVEVLRNQYEWSYTETIYTSGRVETTSPHIIAYYDYLEVDELDAKVANIQYVIAGYETVDEIIAIHLTGNNVVIDDAVINDLIAANIDVSRLVAGTLYTDYVKIANNTEENGQFMLIDGSTIQINDGSTVRVQIGEDGKGDYNLYLWDANAKLLWDAKGLTQSGLEGNCDDGGIIKNMAVADDAAIAGHKLDIASVAEEINSNGDAVINAGSVHIGDDSLETWYVQMTNSSDGTLTVIQSQIEQINNQISLAVYYDQLSDIFDEQIWANLDIKVGEISLNVGTQKVTIDELGNYIDKTYATSASLTVLENSIISQVSEYEEGIDGKITEMETKIEQDADSITATVMEQVGEEYATKASLVLEIQYNSSTKKNEGVISANADRISLTTGDLIISSTPFSINESGYVTINATNFTLDTTGKITASSGTIGGITISGSSLGSSTGLYLASDGLKMGSTFQIDSKGAAYSYGSSDLQAKLSEAKLEIQVVASSSNTYTVGTFGYVDEFVSSTYHEYISIYENSDASGSNYRVEGVVIGKLSGSTYPIMVASGSWAQSQYGHEILLNRDTYIKELTVGTMNQTLKTYYDATNLCCYHWGKFVWIRIYNISPSTLNSNISSFPKPIGNCSFPMVYMNNGNEYLGFIYYNGSWNEAVAANYGGSTASGTQYNGTYYGNLFYFTDQTSTN